MNAPYTAAPGEQSVGSVSRGFADALTAELPRLRRFAHALCGNATLADDLVQDCIERALRQAQADRDIRKLGPWLRSVVHNLFIDEVRRGNSRGTTMDIQDYANDLSLSAPAQGGEVADLLAATARLSEEHRRILVLAGVEALSYREMADELGTPIGTVMSRLARARAALRAILDPAP